MATDRSELVEVPHKYDDQQPAKDSIRRSIQVPDWITLMVNLHDTLNTNHPYLVKDKELLMRKSRSPDVQVGFHLPKSKSGMTNLIHLQTFAKKRGQKIHLFPSRHNAPTDTNLDPLTLLRMIYQVPLTLGFAFTDYKS
ncbi:hypothetical protein OIDMADRAFT_31040 [Oidiodendron maius Zn]|uniref:Uncharacterized protein n=1 Tax=Oidiodendron maius (strain Zn) TaxID=913774 RepID=A0A0C3GQB6_OIDMZ|nr:hypothetical protein OIDMADRAFT_31040 [Oidiodendron maius Zn]